MTTRKKLTLTAALALGLGTAGLLARAESPKAGEKPARVDVYGDGLPDGASARLGTLRWRHAAGISFVAYLPDGKHMFTASQDGALRVWEAATGREVRKFGKINPTGGAQFQLEEEVRKSTAPPYMIELALAPDGKSVVVKDPGRTFTVWEVATGKEVKTITPGPAYDGLNFLVFAPDGKSFFARNYDGFVRQYDVAEGKEVRMFGGPTPGNPVTLMQGTSGGVAVSPDGKTLFAAAFEDTTNNRVVTGYVKSWDVASGKEHHARKGPQTQGLFSDATFSPDAKYLAWKDQAGAVLVWDVAAGKEVAKLTRLQQVYSMSMTFSADGRNLAVRYSDQSVRLWGVVEGKVRLTLAEGRAAGYSPSNLAFAPDGKTLATGTGGNTVVQWDTGSGKEVAAEAGGHHGPVTHVAVLPDGKSVLTRAGDNVMRLWDAAGGKETARHALPATAAFVAFSADARVLALGGYDGTVTVWDAAAGKQTKQWKAGAQPGKGFAFLALAPDGKAVALRGYDNLVRLWDIDTGRELRQMAMLADGGGGPAMNAERAYVYRPMTQALVFSPDGLLLAGVGIDNVGAGPANLAPAAATPALRLWDVATGKQVRRFDAPKNNVGIAAFAFAPDGRTLATANYDGSVTLWECASGKERATFKPGKPDRAEKEVQGARAPGFGPGYGVPALSCVTYSPDGKLLAVGGNDGVIRVCDARTGKEVAELKGHQAAGVLGLVFAAGGKFLASASSDTTALVWETPAVPDDRPQGLALEEKQAEALWADLADADAAKAFVAVRTLSQVPAQAVPLLKGRVQAVPAPDAQKLAQLIADLDANTFAARKKAEDELEKMGELAEDALKQALAGKPGLEMQKRLEGLLAKLVTGAPPHPNQLRALRALEVLEAAGTPEAREVLEIVAKGAAGARLTRDAKGALDRLGKR